MNDLDKHTQLFQNRILTNFYHGRTQQFSIYRTLFIHNYAGKLRRIANFMDPIKPKCGNGLAFPEKQTSHSQKQVAVFPSAIVILTHVKN